jgi:hypothetical protein
MDPDTRRRDYEGALRFYARSLPGVKLVFCENSGADLASLEHAYYAEHSGGAPQTEFLTFTGAGTDPSRGKGVGEAQILDYAFSSSQLLRPEDFVLKVTGRYAVSNIARLVSDFAGQDAPKIWCNLHGNLSWADSRVFGAPGKFFTQYLIPACQDIHDLHGRFFEHCLAGAALRAIADGYSWALPKYYVDVIGVSGTDGKQHRKSLFGRAARYGYSRLRATLFER